MNDKWKKHMKALLALTLALLVTACATPKTWTATGGSRADGTVALSYQYGEFETPVLNEQQGVDEATARCQAWGYQGAEAFGGATVSCVGMGGFGGCGSWQVTKQYQCIDMRDAP